MNMSQNSDNSNRGMLLLVHNMKSECNEQLWEYF